MMMDRETVRNM